ncbi:energy transducer TonB family protein [Viscerimonas tarda]
MDEISKDKIVSIAGTIGVHVLILVLLLLYVIRPSSDHRWTEPLEGVPVMFGNVPDAFGDNEALGRGNNANTTTDTEAEAPNEAVAPQQQAVASPATDNNAVATQDLEESVAVKEARKAAEEKKQQEAILAEREKAAKAEAERKAALEAEEKRNINSQMAGLFGDGTGDGSRGNTSGTGTQGVPTGNASYGNTSGVGGWGSYDLGGRGVGRGGLVKPSYTANDYGTVVVDIIVDPQGNVVEATLGRGTNTTSTSLKNEGLRAAKTTKFNPVSKAGNQKGTITYKFNLN